MYCGYIICENTLYQLDHLRRHSSTSYHPITAALSTRDIRQRGLIYIYEYGLTDFHSVKKNLLRTFHCFRCRFTLAEISKRDNYYLLIVIPDVPLFRNFLRRTSRRPAIQKLSGRTTAYRKCNAQGQLIEKCLVEKRECHHCYDSHMTGSQVCRVPI